jgi:hypothetical protein
MERFWSKVDKSGECWLWTAYRDHSGYGIFGLNGRNQRAPRVAYELLVGPIPQGMYILHSCDNPPCVNPSHLRVGTNLENVQDKMNRGREYWSARTHCKNGHPFDELNTHWAPGGFRRCRACQRAADRRFATRRAERKVS